MDKEEIDIRYTRPMDAPYLRTWLEDARMCEYLSVSNEQEREEMIKTWMFFARFQSGLTATINHIPCGMGMIFLMPYRKVSHHASFKVCVDPKGWRQGVGSVLVKNLLHLAKNYLNLEAIHIEVFGENPVKHILQKFDFREFARQENYVKTPEGVYLPRTCFIAEWERKDEVKTG